MIQFVSVRSQLRMLGSAGMQDRHAKRLQGVSNAVS